MNYAKNLPLIFRGDLAFSVHCRADIEYALAGSCVLVHGRDFNHYLGFLAGTKPLHLDLFHKCSGVNEACPAEQLIRQEGCLPRFGIIYCFHRIQLRADENIIIGGICKLD